MESIQLSAGRLWTRTEILAALHVYLLLEFGQLHQNQPLIKQLATWLGRSAGSVALKLVNLASLDARITSSGRGGMKNASALDREVWRELLSEWDRVARIAATAFETLAAANGAATSVDVAGDLDDFAGHTRSVIFEARVDQARFRRAVLASYGGTCCISGLRHPKLVVASHIVPWSESTKNRLNPQNGLCLSALHDRAYDQGLITVMPSLRVKVSGALLAADSGDFGTASLLQFDGQPIRLPGRFLPNPAFLEWHASKFGFL